MAFSDEKVAFLLKKVPFSDEKMTFRSYFLILKATIRRIILRSDLYSFKNSPVALKE